VIRLIEPRFGQTRRQTREGRKEKRRIVDERRKEKPGCLREERVRICARGISREFYKHCIALKDVRNERGALSGEKGENIPEKEKSGKLKTSSYSLLFMGVVQRRRGVSQRGKRGGARSWIILKPSLRIQDFDKEKIQKK